MMKCKHEETEFRRQRIGRDGAEKYFKIVQCVKCGKRLKNPGGGMWWKVENGENIKDLPPYDAELENNIITAERNIDNELRRLERERNAKIAALNARKEANARHLAYETYIRSSKHWQETRQLVLERCNWLCEGCGRAKATQVHHINYDSLYNELLYSLRGLCSSCHKRAHQIEQEA